jgi:type IV fimbrial biogenesis protein FimT
MSERHAGFTLIELMVTIAVVAILLGVAVPAFTSSQLSTQLRTSTNNLIAGAHLARSEAIKRNTIVRLCVSADGATCGSGNWNQGWIVVSGAEVLHREDAISDRYHIITASDAYSFKPTGVDTTAGNFVICRDSPVGTQERVVTIDAIGRAWAARTNVGVCP